MAKRKYTTGTEAVTVPEAARMLGVGEFTLRHRIRDGTVPVFRIGRLVRISRKAIERIMEGTGNDYGMGQKRWKNSIL